MFMAKFVLIVSLAVFSTWANAGPIEDCNQTKDKDLTIQGCTRFLQIGTPTREHFAKAHFLRGLALAHKGLNDKAIADFSKTIALLPTFAPAYGERADLIADPHRALEDLSMAIRLEQQQKSQSFYYAARGLQYEKLKERDKAIADYRKALELNPNAAFAPSGLERLGATQ